MSDLNAGQSRVIAALREEIARSRKECEDQRKVLDAIYDHAKNTLLTASRDIGDWVDDMERIGLLAATED